MATPRSVDVLVRAARLYYEDGLSQGEVAKIMRLSGSTVSRVLAAAREQGLVEIRIHDPRQQVVRAGDIEQELVATFGLTEARVGVVAEGLAAANVVGKLGVAFFLERLDLMKRVGLSWGSTIGRLVSEFPTLDEPAKFTLLPLVGGLPTHDTASAGGTLIQALGQKCGVDVIRLIAPAIVESPETCAAFKRESGIQAALAAAATVDHAFVGIGSYGVRTSLSIVASMKLTPEEMAAFTSAKPAGDVCGRFVDDEGRPLGLPTSERVIGITIDELRQVPMGVGLAAELDKVRGVLATLRTGAIDAVILDRELARAVLTQNQRDRR